MLQLRPERLVGDGSVRVVLRFPRRPECDLVWPRRAPRARRRRLRELRAIPVGIVDGLEASVVAPVPAVVPTVARGWLGGAARGLSTQLGDVGVPEDDALLRALLGERDPQPRDLVLRGEQHGPVGAILRLPRALRGERLGPGGVVGEPSLRLVLADLVLELRSQSLRLLGQRHLLPQVRGDDLGHVPVVEPPQLLGARHRQLHVLIAVRALAAGRAPRRAS
mmetsp:Transcript_13804/g.55887  ORF Transcript_13804/g.55887 Transcript_13804/m.55887 type:complete len:222 (-) Transcript_13804:257-922(-)